MVKGVMLECVEEDGVGVDEGNKEMLLMRELRVKIGLYGLMGRLRLRLWLVFWLREKECFFWSCIWILMRFNGWVKVLVMIVVMLFLRNGLNFIDVNWRVWWWGDVLWLMSVWKDGEEFEIDWIFCKKKNGEEKMNLDKLEVKEDKRYR